MGSCHPFSQLESVGSYEKKNVIKMIGIKLTIIV